MRVNFRMRNNLPNAVTTYAEFQAKIDEIDARIRDAENEGSSISYLCEMRDETVREWSQRAES